MTAGADTFDLGGTCQTAGHRRAAQPSPLPGRAVGETWRAPTRGRPPRTMASSASWCGRGWAARRNSGENYSRRRWQAQAALRADPPRWGGFEIVPVRLKPRRSRCRTAEKHVSRTSTSTIRRSRAWRSWPTRRALARAGRRVRRPRQAGAAADSTLSGPATSRRRRRPCAGHPEAPELAGSSGDRGTASGRGRPGEGSVPTGNAQEYRLTLQPGHASAFRENDLVRLRRRPIFPKQRVSDVLRVKATPAANQAHLDVTVLFARWTSTGVIQGR